MKTLDRKLAAIRSGAYRPTDFIIADAKDADMAFGLPAPGPARDAAGSIVEGFGRRDDHLAAIRAMTQSGLVDILLASVSNIEILAGEGLFRTSPVTPAVRYNDTTDIWAVRGGNYLAEPSHPFRTARLAKLAAFADLGLYSITFSNRLDDDLRTLEAYGRFREEAEIYHLRHFLEVFNPAFEIGLPRPALGDYIDDAIVRCLAGMVSTERPLFLKIAYNGRRAMEALASFDPTRLVVGILGGAKGTTRDSFELLSQAEAAGARIGLFGRKIAYAEDPIALVRLMRGVLEGNISPAEAVVAYHDQLAKANRRPVRPLEEDSQISDPILRED